MKNFEIVVFIILLVLLGGLSIGLLVRYMNEKFTNSITFHNNMKGAEHFIVHKVVPNLRYGTEPKVATSLFSDDAILVATISANIRKNHQEIKEYFDYFLTIPGLTPGTPYKIVSSNLAKNLYIVNLIVPFKFEKESSINNRMSFIVEYIHNNFIIKFLHASPSPFPLEID
tara:strand:+ start:37 stop:549 length:513 start_codon:yes stop_codon:yes gene_type:complete